MRPVMNCCVPGAALLLLLLTQAVASLGATTLKPTATSPTRKTRTSTAAATTTSTTERPASTQHPAQLDPQLILTGAPQKVTKLMPANCTKPMPVNHAFKISGPRWWELLSHDDYLSNSASMYSNNMNCSWRISNPFPNALFVIIRIVQLNMESANSLGCKFDSLSFSYGDVKSSNAPVKRVFCGTVQNQVLLFSSNVNITFRTDASVTHRGFQVQWVLVSRRAALRFLSFMLLKYSSAPAYECSPAEEKGEITVAGVTAPGGRLVSHATFGLSLPNLYNTYGSNMRCQWTLTSPTGYTLVWIEYLQLQAGNMSDGLVCPYDNLTIAFINADGQSEKQTFCHIIMDRMLLARRSVSIKFVSDASVEVEARGFHLKWLYLNETQFRLFRSSWSQFANSTSAICTKMEPRSNLTLSGVGTYPGGRLMSHTEYLTALNSSYHPNMRCNWTINPPNTSTLIHVKILSLDLETGSGNVLACRYDNLTFSFLNPINSRWEQRVACSSLQTVKFTSSGSVSIKFVTDHSIARRGFHLEWYFVPRGDMVKLPESEALLPVDCPSIRQFMYGSHEGVLSMINYQPNTHCTWRWTLNADEQMEFDIRRLNLDARDRALYSFAPCQNARDKLSFNYYDEDGNLIQRAFCGPFLFNERLIVARGVASVNFVSDSSVQGRGFILFYRRVQIKWPKSDCTTALHHINGRQAKLIDRLPANMTRRCVWRLQPVDEKHVVQITVQRFEPLTIPLSSSDSWLRDRIWTPSSYQYSPTRFDACSHRLTLSSNRTIARSILHQAASQIYTDQLTDANFTIRSYSTLLRSMCHNRYMSSMSLSELSVGPVEIRIESTGRSPGLVYEILIDQVPLVTRTSAGLCPAPTVLSTRHQLIETNQLSRLMVVKQMQVAFNNSDCQTAVMFEATRPAPMVVFRRGDMLQVSVRCVRTTGQVFVVADDTVRSVACNSEARLNWTNQQMPVLLETNGTGGFVATLGQIKWISDGRIRCPTYNPTSHGRWIATLPFFILNDYGYPNYVQDMFYCTFQMLAPPSYDLVVQITLPVNVDNAEQFCSLLSTQPRQPQLKLVIVGPTRLGAASLCRHNLPGELKFDNKLRVPSGSSITVDLTAATMLTNFQHQDSADFIASSVFMGLDAQIVVTQVETCQPLMQSQWRASQDRSQAQTILRVGPGGTQTDCRLQLDAATIGGIANANRVAAPKAGSQGCWSLHLMLSKFGIACSSGQLVLTASYWDAVVDAIVHRRMEVCGNTTFGFRMMLPARSNDETGLSLYYSEVRSGFEAKISVSACELPSQSDASAAVARLGSTRDSSTTGFVVAILVLSLGIVCAALFAFRLSILAGTCALVTRTRGSPRLSYTTGGDGQALLNES